jgi:eukaryotic-like serine/threonine-protein kinase
MARPPTGSKVMPNSQDDTMVARAVVETRLMTQEEVNACKRKQVELARKGEFASLADVFVQEGFVTKNQMERITKHGVLEDSMTRSARHIPGYHIISKLGQGAMATVWKARQLSLERIVAIKILPKRLSENPEFVERFYKEGKAAAKLNSPNIVQAIDVGEAQGYHYFVMEYVEGKTVYDDLSKGIVYTEAKALDIIIQVARALAHAHGKGLIHRDVKPKNIMITKEDVVKLADMGLARAKDDKETAAQEAGRAYGTPYYISPEQIRGELDIDFRADIYSLGATFYHMVTGKVPFDGPSPSAVMHKHLKEPLLPPDHINTGLSSGVAETIEVMMAKKRDNRYASTEDLLKDLLAVQRGEPPLQARRRVDPHVLRNLVKMEKAATKQAEEAETLSAETVMQDATTEQTRWTVTIVLAVLLGLSWLFILYLLLRH